MNIALTGGISTGKSTVSRILVKRGARLVDADRIAKELIYPGSEIFEQIIQQFGAKMVCVDGSLDRKRLGRLIFANPSKRQLLEQIIHPFLYERIVQHINQVNTCHPHQLVVFDIPLLFELGWDTMFDFTLVVYAPKDIQLQRLIARDGWHEDEAKRRLQAQWDIEYKRKLADIIIDNTGSIKNTIQQINRLLEMQGW